MTVTKSLYDRVIADRPFKLNVEEVNYREAEGPEQCKNCVHLFERAVDQFRTCEIFRPDDESSIEMEYTCSFHTTDNETFPLLKDNDDKI